MEEQPSDRRKSRIAQTLSTLISCSRIRSKKPQESLQPCEPHRSDEEDANQEVSRARAAMEAFVAKLFASVSAAKAAYAELQSAQIPYNRDAIRSADRAVVDQLKALADLRQRFANQQIDSPPPPHVTLALAEIQEHQSLVKTYEVTMRQMQAEIDAKEARITSLQNHLRKTNLNSSGSIDGIRFSDVSHTDFALVLHHLLKSVRGFVNLLIREMESANWDIDAAVDAIHRDVVFENSDHKSFAIESFVCREIFSGFTSPGFGGEIHEHDRRSFFFDQFRVLRSASAINFAKQSPNSLFGEFLKSKYLQVVHPRMETSFTGNLYQREMVESGEFPETEFFKAFAEMGRRLWLLHSLALSFDCHVSVFQVSRNSKFSQVYMESVTEELVSAAADGEALRVTFTVVPGFKVGETVVQSRVYLSRLN
ncbi:protein GRAVITROPIC IN THE LIGHT 1-like [Salvia hispanica]|uniref:protein GRAVITROPIC IN THE LIGHT 1-like n=1 Tax=Salvia hispanica TaxID=49212 RepID=UPI002009880A|nr:protein GRAVITROPIC IN THE LIGHT 1-like [Salvia hispanica]